MPAPDADYGYAATLANAVICVLTLFGLNARSRTGIDKIAISSINQAQQDELIMDRAAIGSQLHEGSEDLRDADEANNKTESGDARAAQRFTLLIRAAKLVSPQGEFVCVVRDVSETGISVRLFHKLPTGSPLELHMADGSTYELNPVWENENQAGFEFVHAVDVSKLISDVTTFPKRGLRLGLFFPVKVSTLTQSHEAIVENLSQQGGRFECEGLFAIDQSLRIESMGGGVIFKDVTAKVRWRRDSHYGVVFDDTLTLRDFARFAARLQCPALLD